MNCSKTQSAQVEAFKMIAARKHLFDPERAHLVKAVASTIKKEPLRTRLLTEMIKKHPDKPLLPPCPPAVMGQKREMNYPMMDCPKNCPMMPNRPGNMPRPRPESMRPGTMPPAQLPEATPAPQPTPPAE
ncbi:MAG: hypothetical protein A2Y07_05235 [Planctomycetes bacterium GWF2_50_10]|nr:MAG: hypothetical protein A2Y07_05235 [Planctomycetes bacterium GWF2_50_10]